MSELNVFSTFPISDTYSILSGDTLFDFIRGIVTLSDGTIIPMARRSIEDSPLKFLWIDCNDDVNAEVRYQGEIQYKGRVASDGFYFQDMAYDELIITTTATIATQVIGSSSSIGGVGGGAGGGGTGADIEDVEADIDGKEAITANALGYGKTSTGVTVPIDASPANTARAITTTVQTTQHIGAEGAPMPSGADAAHPIHVSTGGAVATTVGDGRAFVTTPGTAVALATSTAIKEVTVMSETNNTDIICVGGSTVLANLATRRGIPLYPGDSITLKADNLAEVFHDAIVATEGVTFTWLA